MEASRSETDGSKGAAGTDAGARTDAGADVDEGAIDGGTDAETGADVAGARIGAGADVDEGAVDGGIDAETDAGADEADTDMVIGARAADAEAEGGRTCGTDADVFVSMGRGGAGTGCQS